MMQYGILDLKVERYTTKISMSNEPSITLFKKLGFQVESESKVFQEVTLALDVGSGTPGRDSVLTGFGVATCRRETFSSPSKPA